jgi:C4-type Zn-finger protein
MQRRGKHASITIEELLGNAVFSWGHSKAYIMRIPGKLKKLRESLDMDVEDN